MHLVLQVLNDKNIDIACIQETWFTSESGTITSIIKQAGYNIVHFYRTNKVGAGVAILWKPKLEHLKHVCKIKTKDYVSLHYQCIVFDFKPKLIIISIYRLQEIPFKQFLEDLDDLITDHFNNTHSLILLGDFNVHFDYFQHNHTIRLVDLASSFGLSQLIEGSTHKHSHGSRFEKNYCSQSRQSSYLLFLNQSSFTLNQWFSSKQCEISSVSHASMGPVYT